MGFFSELQNHLFIEYLIPALMDIRCLVLVYVGRSRECYSGSMQGHQIIDFGRISVSPVWTKLKKYFICPSSTEVSLSVIYGGDSLSNFPCPHAGRCLLVRWNSREENLIISERSVLDFRLSFRKTFIFLLLCISNHSCNSEK